MILTCPSCGTQYVVKDGAIPPEGRHVRCAACKHSWHQEPDDAAAAATAEGDSVEPERVEEQSSSIEAESATDSADDEENLAEATLIDPRSGPEAEERAYEEAVIDGDAEAVPAKPNSGDVSSPAASDYDEPPEPEAAPDMFTPFAAEDELEPQRRSPLKTILIVALVIIVLAALFWFLAPMELKARLGFAAAGASPLALVMTHMDRQQLQSGNQLLTISGRVVNPTPSEQDVPPLQARLTDKAGKVVYSWTIAPPARSIPAGGSASFNSAEANVPPGGEFITITPGQPKA